ncbi:DUF5994 family protein [Nucisporomicrobium flavum]|uniref:DUF5994 family protein n=1 Tax=Nucisporomicrobium flavum TaxID=2785915 RepID=UPI0018F2DEF4|nr:DUF5994 family protein [Nucisporomicrobium flavum]
MTTPRRTTTVPTSPPSTPRLALPPVRAGQAVLDGAWWPRSWDPVAELPGLLLALSDRYGPVRQVMLHRGTWIGDVRRLAVGTRRVQIGWFGSLDPALAIATTDRGDQIDLLVVPPRTPEALARSAMAMAADPANTMRAAALLAAAAAAPARTPPGAAEPTSAWDNEGGHLAEVATSRPATPSPTSRAMARR